MMSKSLVVLHDSGLLYCEAWKKRKMFFKNFIGLAGTHMPTEKQKE